MGKCQGLDVVKRCADCTGTRRRTGMKVKVICNSPPLGMLRTSGSFLASTRTGNSRQQAAVKRAGAQPWPFCSCHALYPLLAGLMAQLRHDGGNSSAVGQCSKALSNLQVLEFDPICHYYM